MRVWVVPSSLSAIGSACGREEVPLLFELQCPHLGRKSARPSRGLSPERGWTERGLDAQGSASHPPWCAWAGKRAAGRCRRGAPVAVPLDPLNRAASRQPTASELPAGPRRGVRSRAARHFLPPPSPSAKAREPSGAPPGGASDEPLAAELLAGPEQRAWGFRSRRCRGPLVLRLGSSWSDAGRWDSGENRAKQSGRLSVGEEGPSLRGLEDDELWVCRGWGLD